MEIFKDFVLPTLLVWAIIYLLCVPAL